MTNKELPEGYEDELTKLLKPKDERDYNHVAEFVRTIQDVSVRLKLAEVIKAGVDQTAVSMFLMWINKNLSHQDYDIIVTQLPLVESTKFKKFLSGYFQIGSPRDHTLMPWQVIAFNNLTTDENDPSID